MHRAWNIPEVVYEVASHVDRKSLLSLTRTASFFERPASALLYAAVERPYLDSLARQLTSEGDEHYQDDTDRRVRCLCRANLVREIKFSYDPKLSWNLLLRALIVLRQPFFPFPNLRKILVWSLSPTIIQALDVLLCPALEDLSFALKIMSAEELSAWDTQLFFFFRGLPEKAGRISTLAVEVEAPVTEPMSVIEEFESRLERVLCDTYSRLPLVSLDAAGTHISLKLIQTLAAIDTLESLELSEPIYEGAPPIPVNVWKHGRISGVHSFSSLKNVELVADSTIGEVVKCLNGAKLRKLEVRVLEWGQHMAVLLEAVCSFASTLEVLKMSEAWDNFHEFPVYSYRTFTLPGRALARLSGCSRLQSFHFGFGSGDTHAVRLSIADLEELAKGWTKAETIHINYGSDKERVMPILTFEAFRPFSLCCPDLQSITIDPLSPTLEIPVPPSSLPSHPWSALTVGLPETFLDARGRDASKIGQYLDTLWGDVFLTVQASQDYSTWGIPIKTLNGVLDILRTARALRPGSRWRMEHPDGSYLLSEVSFLMFSEVSAACPWELVA